jgi:hypothetical protein
METISSLGKRTERILIVGILVAALAAGSGFLKVAFADSELGRGARAYKKVVLVLDENRVSADKFYQDFLGGKKLKSWEQHSAIVQTEDKRFHAFVQSYDELLSKILSYAIHEEESQQVSLKALLVNTSPPSKIRQAAQEKSTELLSRAELYGVVLPSEVQLNIYGVPIRAKLAQVVKAAFLITCVVVIIWLGALTETRGRELLAIRRSKVSGNSFPHILNSGNTLYTLHSRKKSSNLRVEKNLARFMLLAMRMSIVSLIGVLIVFPLFFGAWTALVGGLKDYEVPGLLSIAADLLPVVVPVFQIFSLLSTELFHGIHTEIDVVEVRRDF